MERNRNLVGDNQLRTFEMVLGLSSRTGFGYDSCLRVQAAWIHTIRNSLLARIEEDRNYLTVIAEPKFSIHLDNALLPGGLSWSDFSLRAEAYSGLNSSSVRLIIQLFKDRILALDGQRPFEPIGWIKPVPDGYIAYLWQDFLCPSVMIRQKKFYQLCTLKCRSRSNCRCTGGRLIINETHLA